MFFAHFFNELYIIVMEKFFTCSETVDLPCSLPESAVWSRLGRNRCLSRIAPEEEVKFKLAMHRALDQCVLRGRWRLLRVNTIADHGVTADDNWFLPGKTFAEFARDADFLWVGAVTAGALIVDLIRQTPEKLSEAAIYDAVGSEVADQGIAMLQKIAVGKLARYGLNLLPHRFSAGYGEVGLCEQQRIFELLKLDELGMSLSSSFIMQPEKSVTAFAAVQKVD